MKRFLALFLPSIFMLSAAGAQDNPQRYRGWPSQEKSRELRASFSKPPKGYGNVPFFWFNGDSLSRERMSWELDILSQSATDGFAVSYIHRSPAVDSLEHKDGYGLFGHTEPGEPPVFSEEWWSFWKWFSDACAQRSLAAGLDDYTMGWIGNGYYPDEAYRTAKYSAYPGKLHFEVHEVPAGGSVDLPLPQNTLSVVAYLSETPGEPILLTDKAAGGNIHWQAPAGKAHTLYITYTSPDYLLHPDAGSDLVKVYFDRFEQQVGPEGVKGMNYFFQDELLYPLTITAWSEDMQSEFLKRKGYDITPFLPGLQYGIGNRTAKVRLDYCDVVMTLSEERYFKPIFDWHDSRGLIYGCDNLGRGRAPLSYLDYFRATSWFTAPGNDAPARGSSFIQTKVSSSIAHAYGRPRTWLEAFHSMGWGSKAEWLTEQIDHHIIAGGNLVCMHGLYYSTHGGWWEWAPPCFHFRMPYWPHMQKWLEYTERLSYLTSQGRHVCDIALLYPTETLQAYDPNNTEDYDFGYILELSDNGLDYDFLDNRSLCGGRVDGSSLQVGEEQYKILVLKDIRAIRFDALKRIQEFYRAGGIVLAVGCLPSASDRAGENDRQLDRIVSEIFGISAFQAETVTAKVQSNAKGGKGIFLASQEGMIQMLRRSLIPDFNPGPRGGKVLHRRVGDQDVYMTMNVSPGTECFFRAKGQAELWNATEGTFEPLPVSRVSENGTYIRLTAPENRSSLVVFSPGEPTLASASKAAADSLSVMPIEGEWMVEYKPTLDNRWGDFRLPKSEGMIGPEARSFRYAPLQGLPKSWMAAGFEDSTWRSGVYGFGPKMNVTTGAKTAAEPYEFSWQYGVYGQPGSQGYHGLKGRVDEHFLILDKGPSMRFSTRVFAPENGEYIVRTGGVNPTEIAIDNQFTEAETALTLKKGWHDLSVFYDNTNDLPRPAESHLLLDTRPRSAVVMLPASDTVVPRITPYSDIVAMDWFRSAHLEYGPEGAPQRTAYRFAAAPGLESMEVALAGTLEKAWVDGVPLDAKKQIRQSAPGVYEITLPEKALRLCTVALQVLPQAGHDGAAVFTEPVKLRCGTGLMKTGDWSKEGSLLYYSGGMYYRKTVLLRDTEITRGVILDLGEVSATCEIRVNGREAGVHIYSPFRSDITELLHHGDNLIEVLVYSTLANHYQTIPTHYRGDPEAGLIGPARLILGGK